MIFKLTEENASTLKSVLENLYSSYGNIDEVIMLSSVVDEIILQEQTFILRYNRVNNLTKT